MTERELKTLVDAGDFAGVAAALAPLSETDRGGLAAVAGECRRAIAVAARGRSAPDNDRVTDDIYARRGDDDWTDADHELILTLPPDRQMSPDERAAVGRDIDRWAARWLAVLGCGDLGSEFAVSQLCEDVKTLFSLREKTLFGVLGEMPSSPRGEEVTKLSVKHVTAAADIAFDRRPPRLAEWAARMNAWPVVRRLLERGWTPDDGETARWVLECCTQDAAFQTNADLPLLAPHLRAWADGETYFPLDGLSAAEVDGWTESFSTDWGDRNGGVLHLWVLACSRGHASRRGLFEFLAGRAAGDEFRDNRVGFNSCSACSRRRRRKRGTTRRCS